MALDRRFETRACVARTGDCIFDVGRDEVEMHRCPVAIIAATLGGVRKRPRSLGLRQQIDEGLAGFHLDAGSTEATRGLEPESIRVERDRAVEIRHIDVDEYVHAVTAPARGRN